MLLVCGSYDVHLPAKLSYTHYPNPQLSSSSSKSHLKTSTFIQRKLPFKLFCSSNEQQSIVEGFSALESESPWESGKVWSTMALYLFSFHVPLSFGGLSFVANLLHQSTLEPQTKAVSILLIQILELFAALLLLHFTAKPEFKPISFFTHGRTQSTRNWMFAAFLGFVVLVAAMFFTSNLSDRLFENEDANNEPVKEILLSGTVAQTSCTLAYCIVGPLLEEIIYRRFFLTSLSPNMGWQKAVIVSSVIFAAAHLSGENFIQLFIIGVVLGSSYCWTGDLRSSTLLHSMYNALTLLIIING